MRLSAAVVALACAASCSSSHGVPVPVMMWSWNRPFDPFHVVGNVYYVGRSDISSFLITTPKGHILIDSIFEADVPRLRDSVQRLGFRFEDVKILLSSHAHVDHVQGHEAVRRQTGARVLVSAGDAPVIEGGGKGDFLYEGEFAWTPCPVDGIIKDEDRVELGGTTLVAHLTPGHTKGATTWTMQVDDGGQRLDVVVFPSANVNPGTRLVGNPKYPRIADDYRESFARWKAMPCDVFLGSHGSFFGLKKKYDLLKAGAQPNPFIDPKGFKRTIVAAEKRFLAILESER
ncbi:MAG TPA: subclass B3 metallo-beta-lactamase [Polyangia bacterium]|jgi:metallo-beta-lactamase class B|nr:subclass B3 metallo-beta-lactamase [Polyangia bacterium]